MFHTVALFFTVIAFFEKPSVNLLDSERTECYNEFGKITEKTALAVGPGPAAAVRNGKRGRAMNDLREIVWRQRGRDPLSSSKHSQDDSVELIQMLSTGGTVLLSDRVEPIRAGTVFLIDGAFVHCTNPEPAEDYERNKCIMSRRFFGELTALLGLDPDEWLQSGGRVFLLSGNETAECDRLFRAASDAAKSANGRALAASAVTQLAALLAGLDRAPEPKRSADENVSRILAFLGENLTRPLTVDEIAAGVSLSKYYLCRLFRAKTGMTVMDYLLLRRLAQAKTLLSATGEPVGAIAAACGFSGASYFSRVFCEREGMPPGKWRKAHRNAGREAL